ncbi:hypothetical protein HC031_06805 [Planosporangium thailandense]|uniref:Uncharacterized protein n=1 Tax=Planosporangium thailandense TaxID=765197 RepID=A0ABX0XVZ7_9ACTN|nr:hypothetical protein [Planosporangium thailandense]NJC69429.1 hypothetical protein [Planosporangium thailandense]
MDGVREDRLREVAGLADDRLAGERGEYVVVPVVRELVGELVPVAGEEVQVIDLALPDRLHRADLPLVGGEPVLRTVHERGRPLPQVTAAHLVERVDPVVAVVPDEVSGQRRRQRDREHSDVAPPHPPDQQVQQHDDGQGLADGTGDRRRREDQPGQGAHPRRQALPPAQHQHGGQQQGGEQRLGHDVVLEDDLPRVQDHRCRRERGAVGRHAAPREQRVHADAERETEQVLDHRDGDDVPGEREALQEQRVAERPDPARRHELRGLQVREGVAEVAERGWIGGHDGHPDRRAHQQQPDQCRMRAERVTYA